MTTNEVRRADSFLTLNQIGKPQRVYLVLTHPYAYDRGLNRAIALAQSLKIPLLTTFIIDMAMFSKILLEMEDSGWLEVGSARSLQTPLLKSYRTQIEKALPTVQRQVSQAGSLSEITIKESSLEGFIRIILSYGNVKIVVSASRFLTQYPSAIAEHVEWIEECESSAFNSAF